MLEVSKKKRKKTTASEYLGMIMQNPSQTQKLSNSIVARATFSKVN